MSTDCTKETAVSTERFAGSRRFLHPASTDKILIVCEITHGSSSLRHAPQATRRPNQTRPGPSEDLRDLYRSPGAAMAVASRTLRWAGIVARMGETRNVC